MERRDFIKSLVAALAAVAVPVVARGTLTVKKPAESAVAVPTSFDPTKMYGMAVHTTDRSAAGVQLAKQRLIDGARQHLPRGTKFYVLDGGHGKVHSEFGPQETDFLAWLYSPTPLTPPRLGQVIAEVTA